tara:strand:- start:233 stop:736 length:504 start_codon:yes stop_codon:yes gene_type:complete
MARNKTCPPGVICIENLTMVLFLFFLGIVVYFYTNIQKNTRVEKKLNDLTSSVMKRNVQYMPVNIETQPKVKDYQQVGILSRNRQEDVIMPLYGRPVINGRDKWQYYTATEHNVRLPFSVGGRSSTDEYGCNELFNGDSVYLQGYNDAFQVTIYDDVNKIQYIPYLN